MPPAASAIDYSVLAEFLGALAYPARLELLDQLRYPQSLADIRVPAHRLRPGDKADRPAARQTVQAHLERLMEADLVRSEAAQVAGKTVNRYAVNPQKLYGLTEELRRLSTIYAGRGAASDETGTVTHRPVAATAVGPRLLLVHGVYEGKTFPLTKETQVDGRWTIGRHRELPVALDYDPFVSVENAHVTQGRGGFAITDVPDSKNGTAVNWQPMPKGGTQPLRSGDVINVGRSMLSFVA